MRSLVQWKMLCKEIFHKLDGLSFKEKKSKMYLLFKIGYNLKMKKH
jgi:hypothetical protein